MAGGGKDKVYSDSTRFQSQLWLGLQDSVIWRQSMSAKMEMKVVTEARNS